ncbi:MAG: ATP-binding cassette domain-containing protein, partial [Niameybacter sp.]
MKVKDLVAFFADFYEDFDKEKAQEMLQTLNIDTDSKLKTLSKGNKEKVQLILVMSRKAKLYILDEPIGGVDPAARDYILNTIIKNYSPESTVLIATHLIQEVENICDDIIFLGYGQIQLQGNVDDIRQEKGQSIDSLFREVFKC